MANSVDGSVSVNGAELYYSVQGAGPTCFVLSAIGTEPYKRLTPPQLTDRLRLVYVELRGSGRSTGDPAELTFEVLADDLEAIRRDLGVDQVAILGHSILGVLAVEYGKRRPESVSHVIIAGTPPRVDMAAIAAASAAYFEENASEDRKQVLQDNLASLPEGASMAQSMYAHTPMRFYDPRFDSAPLFEGGDAGLGLLQHLMGTLMPGWNISAESSALDVPIFIAHGRHDYTIPHILWDGVVDELPTATLQIFEKSGHQPFFEEPDTFADTLSIWMATHPD